MSPDDTDAPSPPVSRVEDRERILAETLAHVEALDEQHRIRFTDPPPSGRWKTPAALLVLALAALLAAFPPGWVSPQPPPTPSAEDLRRGTAVALQVQAWQVEVYRMRHGRLPDSIEELPVRLPGIRLVRSSSRVYQLVASDPDGTPRVWDSARPGADLHGAPPWLAGGAR